MKQLFFVVSGNIGASAIAGLLVFSVIALIRYLYSKKETDARANGQALSELKEKGLLTDGEYETKIDNLFEIELSKQVKKTKEYYMLNKLKKQGILTEEEFHQKVNEIKDKIRKITAKIDSEQGNRT